MSKVNPRIVTAVTARERQYRERQARQARERRVAEVRDATARLSAALDRQSESLRMPAERIAEIFDRVRASVAEEWASIEARSIALAAGPAPAPVWQSDPPVELVTQEEIQDGIDTLPPPQPARAWPQAADPPGYTRDGTNPVTCSGYWSGYGITYPRTHRDRAAVGYATWNDGSAYANHKSGLCQECWSIFSQDGRLAPRTTLVLYRPPEPPVPVLPDVQRRVRRKL